MSVDPQAAIVEVRNLALTRGGRELFRAMDWSLGHGKFLAVTGPSGAGKSSLVACLAGSIASSAGECRIALQRPFSVGRVFQNLRLAPNLSALSNTLCGSLADYSWWQSLFGFRTSDRNRAFRILESLGMDGLVHREVRHLSGGEQQRVAIARVLAQDAELILADEPTSNLDPALAARVLSLFRERCDSGTSTVIAVVHDAALVERFADFELRIGPDVDGGWLFRPVNREGAE